MRLDSRFEEGSTLFHAQPDRLSMAIDYHDGELDFRDESVQPQRLRLTGNIGGLGGISPGTRQLINLFHSSGEERTMDGRPVSMRNYILGGGTVEGTFAIPASGRLSACICAL